MRLKKDDYYFELAKTVSLRSTCLRARVGCIIVKNDSIVSTGYVGSARGEINCCDVGKCKREQLGIEPGKNYELCESLHSELNTIINAARNGQSILDGTMYVYFERLDGQKKKHAGPCIMCNRAIINAGIKNVKFMEIV